MTRMPHPKSMASGDLMITLSRVGSFRAGRKLLTFLIAQILLAGAVMVLSVENMLPEHFAEIVMAQISEMGF